MLLPPDDGRKLPFIVRYALGNVRSRTVAVRLVWVSIAFTVFAVLLLDPFLIGLGILALVVYPLSIRWMDRHEAWPVGVSAAEPANPGENAGGATSEAMPPTVMAATHLTTRPSPTVAALSVLATVATLAALVVLEIGAPAPSDTHLTQIVLDALLTIAFGAAAAFVAARRPAIPSERTLTVIASGGMGLVASVGFFIAGTALGSGAGMRLGAAGALAIAAVASAVGLWLTATSGGRLGWALSIPAVLVGWYVGAALWVAHINSV